MIGADVIWPVQFAANGWLIDVTDRFPKSEQSQFLPAPIDSLIYDGKIYGVPWFTDAGLLYYRADLLEKSGYSNPPKTWDQLQEMGRQGLAGPEHRQRLRLPGRPVRGRGVRRP